MGFLRDVIVYFLDGKIEARVVDWLRLYRGRRGVGVFKV